MRHPLDDFGTFPAQRLSVSEVGSFKAGDSIASFRPGGAFGILMKIDGAKFIVQCTGEAIFCAGEALIGPEGSVVITCAQALPPLDRADFPYSAP